VSRPLGTVSPMERFEERFLHVDMDAFFVEVERLRDPTLHGVPVVVGGLGRRGVVASASYEARRVGVRSAMPIGEARRLCPRARFLPPDGAAYGEVSARLFALLDTFTPLVEGLSVDEAFLDIGGLRHHYPSPTAVGTALRRTIRQDLRLPASVGIATSMFLAKLASEDAKPDGLLLVEAGTELAYLHPMPVRRLWGVGEATLAQLEVLGVATVGELAAVPKGVLERRVGRSLGRHLAALAHGVDEREVVPEETVKSISVEATYEHDLVEPEAIEAALLRLCDRLSARLRRGGRAGRSLTLKVRFGDFTTVSRSLTLPTPVDHTPALWDGAQVLYRRAGVGDRGIRLLGLAAVGLSAAEAPRQLTLDRRARDAAAEAAEQVRARFGDESVVPARLVAPPPEGPDSAEKPGRS
jgi:nucleotidyltransferase/DNA polymerase involved in DNA repair